MLKNIGFIVKEKLTNSKNSKGQTSDADDTEMNIIPNDQPHNVDRSTQWELIEEEKIIPVFEWQSKYNLTMIVNIFTYRNWDKINQKQILNNIRFDT